MKKKLLIFTLLLCIFLTVSAVSASDIQQDDSNSAVSSSDVNLQEDVSAAETVNGESNTGEDAAVAASTSEPPATTMASGNGNKLQAEPVEVEVHNYTELKGLFDSFQPGYENEYLIVNLVGDQEYNATQCIALNPGSQWQLRKLVINGNNRILNGFNESAFLFIQQSTNPVDITLNDLIIRNCYDKNNGEKGAVNIENPQSNLTVNNVLFEDNHAGYYCNGGALIFKGYSLILTNSNFTRNYAYDEAGAIQLSSDNGIFYIDNCIFTDNYADYDGTGTEAGDGDGGAIYIRDSTGTIQNCIFTGNRAVNGGALYLYANVVVRIINSNFSGNAVWDPDDGYGNAIMIQADNVVDLINCDVYKSDVSRFPCTYHNFTIAMPDSATSSVDIDITESAGFAGTIKIAIGEEVFDVPFADGHGSTTAYPSYYFGTYNVTLIYKGTDDEKETNITFGQITIQNLEVRYNILNNVTGHVAIEFLLCTPAGEEVELSTPITLKLNGAEIGTVKPFRVYKNTEFTSGTYTIIADWEGLENEINLVVIEDPATVINELNTTLNETKEALIEATANLTVANAKIDELNTTLNETRESLIETSANLTVANAKIDELNTTLNQTQDALIEATANLTVANAKINQLEIAIAELQKTTSQLQASLKQAQAQITSLQNQLNKVANLKSVASAATLKRTAKSYVITATITKKIKGKKVSIVFNGKLYTATTNANGVAKLTIGKAVIKNLKKGKLVYNAIYGDKTIKKTITIK